VAYTHRDAAHPPRHSAGHQTKPSEAVLSCRSSFTDPAMIERYKRLQTELADDLRGLWDPTFERLGGPDADLEAAWSLCSWLTISGAAYERDAVGALNPDWKATAQAR
jgi:hypothetical protein